MHPIIGITSSTKKVKGIMYNTVPNAYIKAIEDNHGTPLILPLVWHSRIRQQIFSLIDGLLLTGGGDVNPALYNEEIVSFRELDRDKDDLELSITKFALKNKIPLFGICRGMQLLAVAAGGTLYQDIQQDTVIHRENKNSRMYLNMHRIYLCSDTSLKKAVETKVLTVVSSHHQAIKEIPQGFILSAYAEDGIIEAIERKGGDYFCAGVQFHPEEMPQDAMQQKLFKAFIAASSTYRFNKGLKELEGQFKTAKNKALSI